MFDLPISVRNTENVGPSSIVFARRLKHLKQLLNGEEVYFTYSAHTSVQYGEERSHEAEKRARALVRKLLPGAQLLLLDQISCATSKDKKPAASYTCYFDPGPPPVLAYIDCNPTDLDVWVWGDEKEAVNHAITELEKGLYDLACPPEARVRVRTSYYMPGRGVASFVSFIHAPAWEDIRSNYPGRAGVALEKLMSEPPDPDYGRLMIWQGPPGTGKTFAIRALMREWKDKGYSFVNVIDADRFLEFPDYYYGVIGDYESAVLFILEDSAESLLTKLRAEHGSRMSRMLNLTDGLLAQGRRDLFLVTFNEEVRELDPAVTRPGRCQANIEFEHFSPEQAYEWLTDRGCAMPLREHSWTLAELYAVCNGMDIDQSQMVKAVGF